MPAHSHPMVSKSDVASLNQRYAPWRIEKTYKPASLAGIVPDTTRRFVTQARNVETGEVIYSCDGWTNAARGQALNAILERREQEAATESRLVPTGYGVDPDDGSSTEDRAKAARTAARIRREQ